MGGLNLFNLGKIYLSKQDHSRSVDVNYYGCQRSEMLPFVPTTALRVLDVGCGNGIFGEALKRRCPCHVDGVEILSERAAEARRHLDRVWAGDFVNTPLLPVSTYDCVVFNDVLEHMVDPAAALAKARGLLNIHGCVVASLPNVRHFPVVWKLIVRGRWDYVDSGILDHTHIRFFTRSTLAELFRDAGYRIDTLAGVNRYTVNSPDENSLWRYQKILQLIWPRRFDDTAYLQFAIVAVPTANNSKAGDEASRRI